MTTIAESGKRRQALKMRVSCACASMALMQLLQSGGSVAAFTATSPLRTATPGRAPSGPSLANAFHTPCSTASTTLFATTRTRSRRSKEGRRKKKMTVGDEDDSTPVVLPSALLTQEETWALLQQAAELRRLRQLNQEMAKQSPDCKPPPFVSVRAKAAGYGEDGWEAYEQAFVDGERARQTLVTRNMGLVYSTVNDIVGNTAGRPSSLNSLSREDLIQEGAIGLARAVDKYQMERAGEVKFSTYSVYWIRAAILRCMAERDDMLRVPEHVTQTIRKVTRAAERLGLDLSGNSSSISSSSSPIWKAAHAAKALAEEAGVTSRQVEEAMRVRERRLMGGYVSFDMYDAATDWVQKFQVRNLEEDSGTLDSSDEDEDSALHGERLQEELSRFLRPKEVEALRWRYGLLSISDKTKSINPTSASPTKRGRWGEAMSFQDVGKQMQVSAEYGRRLCNSAVKKLQQAAADGHLEPSFVLG